MPAITASPSRLHSGLVLPLIAWAALSSCARYQVVPETGRRRPPLQYSEEEMAELGKGAYEEATRGYTLITGTAEAEMVQRVGSRIARATGRHYEWEFRLLDAPDTLNAFCLPGGKVAVFSGIMPVCRDEDGLAVVLGHEIAHATLEHGNERLSQPLLKRLIGLPLSIGANIWGAISPRSRRVVMGAFGIGNIVAEFMPYSQEHEYEADEVGLRYMKAAGYDVNAAADFWLRMIAAGSGSEPGDALSTHPDAEDRAARLRQMAREMQ